MSRSFPLRLILRMRKEFQYRPREVLGDRRKNLEALFWISGGFRAVSESADTARSFPTRNIPENKGIREPAAAHARGVIAIPPQE